MVVNTSASDCLERLVPEMIYYVSRMTLNSIHSLTVTMSLYCIYLSLCLHFVLYLVYD